MRSLRQRYGISLAELANAAGVSQQYVSALELGKYLGSYDYKKSGERLIQYAFERVIERRNEQVRSLAAEFPASRHRLLDFVAEEEQHEL